jgi:predicted GNAT superfamily acetyltransferase
MDEIVISRAQSADLDGIMQLALANEAQAGGMLTGHLPRAMVAETIEQMPVIVARRGSEVVAFLITWDSFSNNESPVAAAMKQAYQPSAPAYFQGPICVAQALRGQGLAQTMFKKLREYLAEHEAVCFIRADNTPSLKAHRAMGMEERADFQALGQDFKVYSFRPPR